MVRETDGGVVVTGIKALIRRFLALSLLAVSVGVTAVLLAIGYEVALVVLGSGEVAGQMSMVVLAAFPSLFALGSLPFWLALRRLAD